MLHGLGLEELAACCGLTKAQVSAIPNHGHARNNRALLFSICAAMIIHLCDLVQTEQPDIRDDLENIMNGFGAGAEHTETGQKSKLLRCVSKNVSAATIRIGKLLRERIHEFFSASPNGKHFAHTVLFTCLLPTVGFHVLSRTGHTDVLDNFWLRLNNVLHTSGHIKYQGLYLFYGFFRAVMPRVTLKELFTLKPVAMVVRVPKFTSGVGTLYDKRGMNYVHKDEALEMLIIRLIKSLSVTILSCLESAAAWLLLVSTTRMSLRSVTAATHSYKRTRVDDNREHEVNAMLHYTKYAAQSATVCSMVDIMRRKGFLGQDHRNTETLRNVFGASSTDLNNSNAQQLILNIDYYGRTSAELHASAILPDVFCALSDEDITEYFGGKRFKGVWTKKRQVPTAGVVMRKIEEENSLEPTKPSADPRKVISDRLHAVTRFMTSLTLAEHAALKVGDMEGAEHARSRWQVLHSARHKLSPFADAYRSSDGTSVRHAQKSQVLSAINLDFVEAEDGSVDNNNPSVADKRIVRHYYNRNMPTYSAEMVDLMNFIWTSGTDGSRGNSMFATIPTLVIPHKRGEQDRCDSRDMSMNDRIEAETALYDIGFLLPITVPWGTLMKSRKSRDGICSLHLFCGAASALELANEYDLDISIFLYGGCFCFRGSSVGSLATNLTPEVALRNDMCEEPCEGEVILMTKEGSEGNHVSNRTREEDPLLRVPRSKVLKFSTLGGLEITNVPIQHGEAETRFVPAFSHSLTPVLEMSGFFDGGAVTQSSESSRERGVVRSGCVILSKDKDVTMILAQLKCTHGVKFTCITFNVIHVLGDKVIEIDTLVTNLNRSAINCNALSCAYEIAGCEFTAGTYGVTHQQYFKAAVRCKLYIPLLQENAAPESFELLTLPAYLEKYGIAFLVNGFGKEALRDRWTDDICDTEEVRNVLRRVSTSEHDVGSVGWRLDVRSFVSDNAKSASELVPASEHIRLQAQRVKFIVFKYWSRANKSSLTADVVQGCQESYGYNEAGEVLLEREEDVRSISKATQELIAMCRCKGECNTRRYSCVKLSAKCIGCNCDPRSCKNKITTAVVDTVVNAAASEEDEEEENLEVQEMTYSDGESMDLATTSSHGADLPPMEV